MAKEVIRLEDLTEPENIEIVISYDGKTVWINTEAGCVFRACKIKNLTVEDRRRNK